MKLIPLGIPRPGVELRHQHRGQSSINHEEKRKASAGKSRASKKPAPSLSSEEPSSAVSSSDDDEEDSCDCRDDVTSVGTDK